MTSRWPTTSDSRLPHIDMTTVCQNTTGLVEHAVRVTIARLKCTARPAETVLDPKLVIRGTTDPQPHRVELST
ncbi:DNA-binding LacI/PurR family transcriptional regulator [Kibdelosporangium banguiense]|uniref:DNA-binding LacI/PurR family transcriptional regulator n=1 Tax=Kibdelosporangium banguiense TaxID=1365924 RepID=A0ABS4TTV5_9PSEU|nr:hypothetical protein [Kibdelosporangium banguiense]MBP2327825.1 DNA-binding LacI/PurR family transcriptional regulator [Kibdelosporangium banguiense]